MAADEQHAGTAIDGKNDEIEATDSPISDTITLEALKLIREAQQQHGLRHGDLQRYRQYCARRIRRIRKSLHFPQGTKHRVQPKKITPAMLSDVRYLYLPLMEAERCWSYAMQLKAEANTELRKKFHMLCRLRKATQHAETLAKLCEDEKCDARTKLEAEAYQSWMKGTLQLEMQNWRPAMEHFNNAKTIYEKLAGAFVDEVKEIYLQKCDEISPNIRYCAYNIGDESAIDDLRQMRMKTGLENPLTSRLDELIAQTREKQAVTLSEVTWRGRTVPVRNEQVRLFLLSKQDAEKQLQEAETSESKISVYETLLKELIDAQQALRDDLKEDPIFKAVIRGQPIEGNIPNTVYLHTYLSYLKLMTTVERNMHMITSLKEQIAATTSTSATPAPGKKLARPQDIARLYDIIIQSLSEVPNLPGIEDEDMLELEISARTKGCKAFRCFYIAQTYEVAKKWREAAALYEQVMTYIEEAQAAYKQIRTEYYRKNQDLSELEELSNEVEGVKYSCQASSILDSEELTSQMSNLTVKNNKPLIDRLEDYCEDPRLATKKSQLTDFPPNFEPVPGKPLFFDVALSLVEFPSLDDRLEQKKQAGGLTGMVKGWLWGGKK